MLLNYSCLVRWLVDIIMSGMKYDKVVKVVEN